METNAPAIGQTRSAQHGNTYPAPGTKLGEAWEHSWKLLTLMPPGEYAEGMALSQQVAAYKLNNGGHIAPVTVLNMLSRAATAGLLEREIRAVKGDRGPRKRSFYRVAR